MTRSEKKANIACDGTACGCLILEWHLFCPKPNNKDEDTVYFVFEPVSLEKNLLSVSNTELNCCRVNSQKSSPNYIFIIYLWKQSVEFHCFSLLMQTCTVKVNGNCLSLLAHPHNQYILTQHAHFYLENRQKRRAGRSTSIYLTIISRERVGYEYK